MSVPDDLETIKTLRPQVILLRTPLLSAGMSRDLLCAGDNSTLRIHCYSAGMGEKHGFHAHIGEEHLFIVLLGQAVFSSLDGRLSPVSKNEGIWLPKGCFYEFFNPGPEPLVVLRFGAKDSGANASLRLDPEGQAIKGRASIHSEIAAPMIMEGRFFE
jgi:mannose-6-phosphate isomerase-like protein (cupin superfamily)